MSRTRGRPDPASLLWAAIFGVLSFVGVMMAMRVASVMTILHWLGPVLLIVLGAIGLVVTRDRR